MERRASSPVPARGRNPPRILLVTFRVPPDLPYSSHGLGCQRAHALCLSRLSAVERGSAKLTIAAYSSDLAQFAEFLEKRHIVLSGARRDDVREYIQELFSNSLDGRSVGRKLSAIRQLYRHLLLDGKIDKDPTLNIDLPKQWKVLPKALSRDEVGAMLAETKPAETKLVQTTPAEMPPRNETARARALALRDRAMIELLYAGGVRVSEVADARLEDLKLEMGCIWCAAKATRSAWCRSECQPSKHYSGT